MRSTVNMSALLAYQCSTTTVKNRYKFLWTLSKKVLIVLYYVFDGRMIRFHRRIIILIKAHQNEYLALTIALNHFKMKRTDVGEKNDSKNYIQIISKLKNSYLKLLFAYILEHRILVDLIVSVYSNSITFVFCYMG